MKQMKSSDKMNSILAAGMIFLLVGSISSIQFLVKAVMGLCDVETAFCVGMTLAEDSLLCILAGITYQRYKTRHGKGRNSTINTYFLGMILAGIVMTARCFLMIFTRLDFCAEESIFWEEFLLKGLIVFLAGAVFSCSLFIKRNIMPDTGYLWLAVIWFCWTVSCLWIFMEVLFSNLLAPVNDILAGILPVIWLAVPTAAAVVSEIICRRRYGQ